MIVLSGLVQLNYSEVVRPFIGMGDRGKKLFHLGKWWRAKSIQELSVFRGRVHVLFTPLILISISTRAILKVKIQ